MKQDEWQRVKEIFHQARELEPDERADFLDKVCGENTEVREQVQILLESYESDFLEDTVLHQVVAAVGSSLQSGQKIGHYRIKELLGAGGMGEVFLAEDTKLHRPVAFKVLHTEIAEDEERVRRFILEARAASALNHPNILTIHEIGDFENSQFIVSEYVKGNTLRERLKEGNLELLESLEVISQIAAALQAAHEAGMVHRDIKPENIMLRKDGLVKVLDFGLAKLTEIKSDETDLENSTLDQVRTNPGIVMGTVAYMSPEQARGVTVDARTDLWSLGVALYEMLSGKLPFPGETTSDIIASILKTEVEPLENLKQENPKKIEAICFKALAKDTNERYQTAGELLQDLRQAIKHLENENEQTATRQFNNSDERNTELIRHRPTSSAEYMVNQVKQHKVGFSVLVTILILTLGVGVGSYWLISRKNQTNQKDKTENSPEKMKISRLTTSGEESDVEISPDGKYVAHLNKHNGKQSIIIRQGATGSSNTVVNQAEESSYSGLTFSPDGDFLYYSVLTSNKETNTLSSSVFRVPILGGNPTPVLKDGFMGYISFAPDGNKIAYLKKDSPDSSDIQLRLAFLDEVLQKKAEPKTLAIINPPEDPDRMLSWSPDGSTIACFISNIASSSEGYRIVGFNAETGERKDLTKHNWKWITSLIWQKNTGDLLITGNQTKPYDPGQVWRIDREGVEHRITNDLHDYREISVSADGSTMTAIQETARAHIYTAENLDHNQKALFTADRFRQVTQGVDVSNGIGGVVWTPDGQLTYGGTANDEQPFFIMDGDGSNVRQLIFDKTLLPGNHCLSPDGRFLVFMSYGNGSRLWRLDLADNTVKQLTFDGQSESDEFCAVTPDGKSIVYSFQKDGFKSGLRQISIEGGEPVDIFEGIKARAPSVAPDGKHLVAYYETATESNLAVFSMLNPGAPLKIFHEISPGGWVDFGWTPDSNTLLYLDPKNNYKNIKAVSIRDGKSYDVTTFTDQQIFSFDLSRDGKRLAVSRGTITTDVVLIKNFN